MPTYSMWWLPVVCVLLLLAVTIPAKPVGFEEEDEFFCRMDTDCYRYPLCHQRATACRCQSWGMCLLLRAYRQRCSQDEQCADLMVCNTTERVCSCDEGSKYSRELSRCVSVVPFLNDLPRFADLPDLDRTDSDFPSIPATYVGPYLVGFISLGLVCGCLTVALWCRFTSADLPPPEPSTPRHPETEKIPLDLFYLPPPEMYQTPGYFNLLALEDEAPGTSRNHLSGGITVEDHTKSQR